MHAYEEAPEVPRVHTYEEAPEPPMLKRSYAIRPGQTEEEYVAMSARLDVANAAIGLSVGGPCPVPDYYDPNHSPEEIASWTDVVGAVAAAAEEPAAAAAASPAPKKRSLEDLVAPGAPKARKKRKRKVTATRKCFAAGGEGQFWELILEDGKTSVLVKELDFA
jgi:hypothetical protein